MLGFEVRYNNEIIRSSIDGGLLEVIFTSGGLQHDNEYLFIWGLTSFHKLVWCSSSMEINKITVRIVDISCNSAPIQKENRFKTDDEILQRYYDLKKELEKDGLL